MIKSLSQKSHPPLAQIDALDKSRRRMLLAVIATSTLWMLPQILKGVIYDTLPPLINSIVILTGIAAGLTWMVFMFKYHQFQMRLLDDPELRQRLDDERVLAIRREAVFRGWSVLVVAIAIGIALAPFMELPDHAVLHFLMLLGVNGPIVFFLILDRG